jgi:glycerophosphoryl diester phosphodiesterase
MPVIQIVGHRGAKSEAPENTVAGILHAARIGLDAVEFDVQLSSDRELIVIHDGTVDRTTNATGAVSEFTAAEMVALDARGTCPSWPEPVGVPTLEQVLDVISVFTTIQLEIKRDTPGRLEEVTTGVLRRLNARSLAPQVIITSFVTEVMELVQRLAPDQERGFIGRPNDPEVVETSVRFGCNHVFFHNFREHDPEHIQRAHEIGLRVGGGPVDSIEDLNAAINLGFAAVTSDIPSALCAHLAAR